MKISVEKISEHNLHTGAIYTSILHQNTVFTSGGDGKIIQFLPEEDAANLVATTDQQIYSISYFSDQNMMVFGDLKGGIHILDLDKKQLIKSLDLHQRPIYVLHQHEGFLIVGAGDGGISIWNYPEFSLDHVEPISRENIRSIHSLSLNRILIGSSDGMLREFDLKKKTIIAEYEADKHSVFSIQQIGNQVLSGGRDGKLKFWDYTEVSLDLFHLIPAHNSTINTIRVSPNYKWIATGSRDKQIRIWDSKTFDLLKVISFEKHNGHRNSVNTLEWASENTLISCGDDRRCIIWKIQ